MENAITDRWRRADYPLPAKKVRRLRWSAWFFSGLTVLEAIDIVLLAFSDGFGRLEWRLLPFIAGLALFSLGAYSCFRQLQGHRAAADRSGGR